MESCSLWSPVSVTGIYLKTQVGLSYETRRHWPHRIPGQAWLGWVSGVGIPWEPQNGLAIPHIECFRLTPSTSCCLEVWVSWYRTEPQSLQTWQLVTTMWGQQTSNQCFLSTYCIPVSLSSPFRRWESWDTEVKWPACSPTAGKWQSGIWTQTAGFQTCRRITAMKSRPPPSSLSQEATPLPSLTPSHVCQLAFAV